MEYGIFSKNMDIILYLLKLQYDIPVMPRIKSKYPKYHKLKMDSLKFT